jgi:secreted trypsin-like serine protease
MGPVTKRLRLITVTAGLLAFLVAASPASAITNGGRDGSDHPNVGLVAAVIPGEGLVPVCSGTLIDADTFLTAAHCTAWIESFGVRHAYVTFSDDLRGNLRFYPGWIVTHEGFVDANKDTSDLAVIELMRPVSGITPAQLPTLGQLSELKAAGGMQAQDFTTVGYGAVMRVNMGPGLDEDFLSDGYRNGAVSSYNALNRSWLHTSQNAALGDGGTCYGDSGGPYFLGDSNVIAAIAITGDQVCRATGVSLRLDTPRAREFLARFVDLP